MTVDEEEILVEAQRLAKSHRASGGGAFLADKHGSNALFMRESKL